MIGTNLVGKWAIVGKRSQAREIVAVTCQSSEIYVYLLDHDGNMECCWYKHITIVATPDGWTPGGPYR